MARPKVKVSSNQARSICAKYKKGAGLIALASEFELSPAVIRRVLVEGDVDIRGRGRPAKAVATA